MDGCVRAGAGNTLLLRALLDDLRAVFPHGNGPEPELPENCAELYSGSFVAAVAWWLRSAAEESIVVARALAELEESAGYFEGGEDEVEPGHGFPGAPGPRRDPPCTATPVRATASATTSATSSPNSRVPTPNASAAGSPR